MKIYIVILLFWVFNTNAQNVTVSGEARSYENRNISAVVYDDYLSFTEIELAKAKIDGEGKFRLSFDIKETAEVIFRISGTDKTLHIEPGRNYNIIYPQTDIAVAPSPTAESALIEFVNNDKNELNELIRNFNVEYNVFAIRNYDALIQGKAKAEADTFIIMMSRKYKDVKNEYFAIYMQYTFASIELLTLKQKQDVFEEKYITSQPVKNRHPEYMNFISHYFPEHLQMMSLMAKGKGVLEAVNEKKSYELLMSELAKDKRLENDTLRELIMLQGLFEIYHNPDFKGESVIAVIDDAEAHTKIKEHKKIAGNLKKLLLKLASGSPAPEFELKDMNGKVVKLSDYKDKYVYLDFWATWCVPCIREMKVMKTLHEKYGNNMFKDMPGREGVIFISISTDQDYEMMKMFLEKNQLKIPLDAGDWIFLHCGNNNKINKDYNILSIPAYFLIDKNGNFMQSPAERPSGEIEKYFLKITEPPANKTKVGDKKN